MELRQSGPALWTELAEAFEEKEFLRKLGMNRADAERVFASADWRGIAAPFTPIRSRISCAGAVDAFRPLLMSLAPEPPEGWLRYAYQVALSLLYPAADHSHTSAQWDGALCFLQFLQVLLRAEGRALPFDPWLDFAFCSEEELSDSGVAEEYRRFLARVQGEYIYELLRMSTEVTPFKTLNHIAGSSPAPPWATTSASSAASPASGCPTSTTTTRISGSPSVG